MKHFCTKHFCTLLLCGLAAVLCSPAFCLPASAFDEDHKEVINGTMLHFRVRGTDKTNPYLLILHGGPGFSAHMFYAWGPSLEKMLNVVYLDQRGCGESARLAVANIMDPQPAEIKDYTFSTLVADIEGVRQSLKVDKWYVLGHSYGGMLGLEYVAAHPEHVRGYVHMDGLVSVPQMQNAILDNAEKKFASAVPKDDLNLTAVKQLRALPPDNPARLFGSFGLALGPAGLYFAGDQKTQFPAFRQQLAAAVTPYHIAPAAQTPANEPAVALLVNEHFLTHDDTPLLAKISVPTLIINGKQDGVVTSASAEAAHAAIKSSQLIELDNCGHFPFYEQPEKTTDAILTFVGSKTAEGQYQEAGPISDYADLQIPRDFKGSLSSSVVEIGFTISDKGRAEQMYVKHSSGNQDIDKACMDAIRRTKFQPAIKEGTPLPQKAVHTFNFTQN